MHVLHTCTSRNRNRNGNGNSNGNDHGAFPSSSSISSVVKKVAQAYTFLSDPKKRNEYGILTKKKCKGRGVGGLESYSHSTITMTKPPDALLAPVTPSPPARVGAGPHHHHHHHAAAAWVGGYIGGILDSARMFMSMVVLAIIALLLFVRQATVNLARNVWPAAASNKDKWCR